MKKGPGVTAPEETPTYFPAPKVFGLSSNGGEEGNVENVMRKREETIFDALLHLFFPPFLCLFSLAWVWVGGGITSLFCRV